MRHDDIIEDANGEIVVTTSAGLGERIARAVNACDSGWIPVTGALPPEVSDGESDVVLVWPRERLNTIYQRLGVYNYRRQRWDYPTAIGYALEMPVTHWMPMPPGPGEG